MTKTAKWSMVGVLVALLLALFAVAGCASDNATDTNAGGSGDTASTQNGTAADGTNGTNGGDNSVSNDAAGSNNKGNTDNANSNANQMGDGGSVGEGTVVKVPNGWVAYSQSDMLVLLDSNADAAYQWTAEVEGDTVLKDADADIPSSTYDDQNADDVIGSAGMHVFGFLADGQNNGESTITMKLANTTNADDAKTTIVVKATVENGTFADVSVQE